MYVDCIRILIPLLDVLEVHISCQPYRSLKYEPQTARGKRFFLFVCFCFCFVSFNLGAKYGAKSCGFFNISLVELVLV